MAWGQKLKVDLALIIAEPRISACMMLLRYSGYAVDTRGAWCRFGDAVNHIRLCLEGEYRERSMLRGRHSP